MQLVRNLYITKERTYQRKIREAKLAEELENEHTKEWILDKYLNTVPFGTLGGQTAVGAQAASRVYFGKPVERLKLHEAALLAGLPQAPSTYSPVRAPEKAEARRNEVLAKMAELGMVTPETARKAMRRGLGVNPSRYFTSRRESFFFDYVKDELIKEYGIKTVRQGGLRVDTTIDLKKQVRGARRDQRPARRHRPLLGDRHDRPQERLHQGDGVLGGLRQVEVQPRRPGPPPARLDVQDHGADDRPAQGRRPAARRATSPSR